jgi:hypothetical protein
MRSPLFIEVALWYYTTSLEHPSIKERAPAYLEAAYQMVDIGLLTVEENEDGRTFSATDGMPVYVTALCEVPTPVKCWVIPDES